jgi:hypothetical protein
MRNTKKLRPTIDLKLFVFFNNKYIIIWNMMRERAKVGLIIYSPGWLLNHPISLSGEPVFFKLSRYVNPLEK